MLLTEEVAVIDNLAGKLYLVVYADPTQPEAYTKAKTASARTASALARDRATAGHVSQRAHRETYREFAKRRLLGGPCARRRNTLPLAN
ncbi:hypothetical protein ACFFYR_39280 [Paraburkholderia dipogonis]|uniref:hypothetical protein n=1 Tax=Paraburkholderia dipogonis TaxID=1211383 RepID=UPI0035EAFF24